MEVAAIIGLCLFLASEILPFLPVKSNGLLEAVIGALRVAFPKPSKEEE
jgi:hypothetical protein